MLTIESVQVEIDKRYASFVEGIQLDIDKKHTAFLDTLPIEAENGSEEFNILLKQFFENGMVDGYSLCLQHRNEFESEFKDSSSYKPFFLELAILAFALSCGMAGYAIGLLSGGKL